LGVALFIIMERLGWDTQRQARIFTPHIERFYSACCLRCLWSASVASSKASYMCWGRRKNSFFLGSTVGSWRKECSRCFPCFIVAMSSF